MTERPLDEIYETIRDVEQDPIGALMAIQQLVAEVARLRERNASWRKNSIANHAAMTAMRNDLNETFGNMPSMEGVLLNGPEWSHDCAAIVEAAASFATTLRAEVARLREELEWTRVQGLDQAKPAPPQDFWIVRAEGFDPAVYDNEADADAGRPKWAKKIHVREVEK